MNDLPLKKTHNFRFLKFLPNIEKIDIKGHECYSLEKRHLPSLLGKKEKLLEIDFRRVEW